MFAAGRGCTSQIPGLPGAVFVPLLTQPSYPDGTVAEYACADGCAKGTATCRNQQWVLSNPRCQCEYAFKNVLIM